MQETNIQLVATVLAGGLYTAVFCLVAFVFIDDSLDDKLKPLQNSQI